jgi:hypothetical protein
VPQRFGLPLPPSNITGELGVWLDAVWQWATVRPTFSAFSGTNPITSGVTGVGGTYAFNITPISNVSRLWVNDGGPTPNTASWRTIG